MKSLKAILSRVTCLFASVALVAAPVLPMPQMVVVRRPMYPAAGGGGGTPLATDNFNRADVNPLGGNWSACPNVTIEMKIVSNKAVPQFESDDACDYYNAVTPSNDQYYQAKMTVGSDTTVNGGSGSCVYVRQSTSVLTTYRLCVNNAATGNITLSSFVTGTHANIWSRTASFTNSTSVLKLAAVGTTLRAYVDGVQVGSDATDSSVTAGRCAIGYSSTSTGAGLDDWECGSIP